MPLRDATTNEVILPAHSIQLSQSILNVYDCTLMTMMSAVSVSRFRLNSENFRILKAFYFSMLWQLNDHEYLRCPM
jgi:hypothetical protein